MNERDTTVVSVVRLPPPNSKYAIYCRVHGYLSSTQNDVANMLVEYINEPLADTVADAHWRRHHVAKDWMIVEEAPYDSYDNTTEIRIVTGAVTPEDALKESGLTPMSQSTVKIYELADTTAHEFRTEAIPSPKHRWVPL